MGAVKGNSNRAESAGAAAASRKQAHKISESPVEQGLGSRSDSTADTVAAAASNNSNNTDKTHKKCSPNRACT
jgi:hypothetical protein